MADPVQPKLATERMRVIIVNNTKVIEGAKKILTILEKNPELDEHFCMIFGIKPMPQ